MGKADNMEQTIVAQQAEDELRLSDIVVGLWDGRWTIAIGGVLGLLVGFALNAILSDAYEAELVLVPATAATEQPYAALNARLDFVPLEEMIADEPAHAGARSDDDSVGDQPFEVTPTLLIESLIRELRSVPVVAESLDVAGLLSRTDFDTEQQFLSEAARFTDTIGFLPPAADSTAFSFQRRFWQMSYAGKGTPAEARAYADAALHRATAKVQERILNIAGVVIDQRAEDEAFALEALGVRRHIAVEEYKSGLAARIARLEEQAAIARRIGLESGEIGGASRFEAETVAGSSESLFSITQEAPGYLRGYAALEEEISLLKQRTDPELFVEDLPGIGGQVLMIEADQQVERARVALEQSPLASEEFAIIDFDPGLVRFDRRYPLPMILFLGLALGTVAGVVLVGVRNMLRNRRI